jgi:hypothetical protein
VTDNIISESVEDSGIDSDGTGVAVKAFSGKTNDEIKKMMEAFREQNATPNPDSPYDMELFNDFSDVLSTERLGSVN